MDEHTKPPPVRPWRWWHRFRWWQVRRATEIARWSAHRHEAIAQCEADEHDWDLHHPFSHRGQPAVVCLWCWSVYVDLRSDGFAVIYPWSDVYPHEDVERVRLLM